MEQLELLQRAAQRERRAREQAEGLLEAKSAELYAANLHLRRLYDHAADAIFSFDDQGNILDVNQSACQSLLYTRDELLSMKVHEITERTESELKQPWTQIGQHAPLQIDGMLRRRDEVTFPAEVRVTEVESEPKKVLLAIARDVTLRTKQRHELEASRKRLRQLSSEVTLTEAKERQRLAQVLHDTIGHDLTVVRMHIGKLAELCETSGGNVHSSSALRLIEGIVKQVRQVTFDLSPAVLYELCLPAAIKTVARVVTEEQTPNCEVESSGNWRSLPIDLAILLYYATRELIHNAVKHASAEDIHVRLDRREQTISITVIDDGKGFEPHTDDHRSDHATYGLFSIRERLAVLGGELLVASEPEMGSSVTLRLPCPANSASPGRRNSVQKESLQLESCWLTITKFFVMA